MKTRIGLRLPDSWYAYVKELAKQDGVSVNQFITLALAEKISALTAENYLEMRAKRADRAKFRAAMSKVANVEPPDPRDRL